MSKYWPYLSLLVAALSLFNAVIASWPANAIWVMSAIVWASNFFLHKKVLK